jgi:hypothetical protein
MMLAVGFGGLAAAAVAAVLFFSRQRQPLDDINLELAYREATQQTGSGPETINQWFEDVHHVRMASPAGFDYRLLVFYDLAEFQGKRVPLLLFSRGDANARVYVLSGDRFNLDEVEPAPGYNVQYLRPADDERTAYVVVYTSESLNGFLTKGESQYLRSETPLDLVSGPR